MTSSPRKNVRLVMERLPGWAQDFVGIKAEAQTTMPQKKANPKKPRKTIGYTEPCYGDTSVYKAPKRIGVQIGCTEGIGGTGISSTDADWGRGYFGS